MIRLKIDDLIWKKRITQAQLAKKAGVSRSLVCRAKIGNKSLRLDTIEKLCIALDCQPGDLFELIPDKPKEAL